MHLAYFSGYTIMCLAGVKQCCPLPIFARDRRYFGLRPQVCSELEPFVILLPWDRESMPSFVSTWGRHHCITLHMLEVPIS